MPRIVSLIASSTEIVHALGFGGALVGRSHECDYPPEVALVPALTEPKIQVDRSSWEIDRQIRTLVEEALSVYRVDAARLLELHPNVIVTQTQCEVCAVSLKDVEAALEDWLGERPKVVSLAPDRLTDVWDDIRRVAQALDAADRGEALIESLVGRMRSVTERARALSDRRPAVACIEWIDPLMAAGNWMPELVEMAGGANLFGEAGRHSPWMDHEELEASDPDVVVILPCGFDIPRTREEMSALTRWPGWPELRAVRDGRVALADGVRYFNRPGPRLVESLEILAEILHPEAFDFGHRGDGWETL